MSERAAGAEAERTLRVGDLARGWGCLVGLAGIAVALVGASLIEGGVGTALVSIGGSAFGVGLLLVVYGVLARLLLPSRSSPGRLRRLEGDADRVGILDWNRS